MYHGCDSNTSPANDPCYDNFYVGGMGMGAITGDSTVYNPSYGAFNNLGDTGNTNAYAGWLIKNNKLNNTYGYWFLLGPQLANPDSTQTTWNEITGYKSYSLTTPTDAYNWGAKQAARAQQAWINSYPNLLRSTIYCDVEQATAAGWYLSGTINKYSYDELNKQVIIGFVKGMNTNSFVGGVYGDPGDFNQITNTWTGLGSYTSHVWVASWQSESTCTPSFPNGLSLGGVSAQIWQYSGNPDLDAAISLPS